MTLWNPTRPRRHDVGSLPPGGDSLPEVDSRAEVAELKLTMTSMAGVIGYLLRPHAWLYAIILVLSVLEGILSGFAIAALFPVFTSLAGLSVSNQGGILSWIQRVAFLLPIRPPIVAAGCLLLVLALFKCTVAWLREVLNSGYASARVNHHLRSRVLNTYIQNGHPFFLNHRQGELVYNLYSACHRVSGLFTLLLTLLAEFINILAMIVLLSSIHAKATIGLLGSALVIHVATTFVARKFVFPLGKARKDSMVAQYVVINEFINGFKQISVFGVLDAWVKIQDRHSREFMGLRIKESAFLAVPKNMWELLVFAAGAVAMVWIGMRNPAGLSGHVATFGVYLVALQRTLPALSSLSRSWMAIASYIPDAHIVYTALQRKPPVRKAGRRLALALRTGVQFQRVSFYYPDRGDVLKDASLILEKGKITAIVGASGAGKTTILNLILGLIEPTSGTIWIDDVDLKDIQPDSWLSQIGFVSQDTFIFHASVRDNIDFLRGCSQAEIEEAARLANADEFIAGFPQGYDTVVGDRGMRLSGGQQQRLALARAILKRPQILILDEATSSLDSLSENLIQESLSKMAVNRTVIVVAHRLSTIVDADKILVLNDGAVVEEGTHGELLQAKGHYSHLYGSDSQSAERRDAGGDVAPLTVTISD